MEYLKGTGGYRPVNALIRFQKTFRRGLFLIVAGITFLIAGAVAAQSQLPGLALTSGPGNDFRPTWNQEGSKIVYHSDQAGDNDIWMVDEDGGNQRQITDGPADDRRPAWSPNGEWVAFDSDRSGDNDIWIVNVNEGNPLQVTSGSAFDNFPSWSPDGRQIAYYSYDNGVLDLWVVLVEDLMEGGNTGQPQRMTTLLADEKLQQCTYACHSPAWSPDGQQIAYGRANNTEVWVVGMDGSDQHQVGIDEGHVQFPWWTSEGKLLMLSEHSSSNQELVNNVWLMDADGGNPTLLYQDIPHGGPFYWNPSDGETIAFHSPRAGNFDIYITNLGEDAMVGEQPTQASEAATEEASGEAADEATQVAQAPNSPASEPESENLRPSPILWLGAALIGLAAVLALGGLVLAVYLFYKNRSS